jgi:FKBP-type peptidyl-prolyl cis-trans isomerase (trigger factor)
LPPTKNKYSVTDAQVEHELEHMLDRNARIVNVEGRAAQLDDMAVIDFEGFVDGVPFEGGKGEASASPCAPTASSIPLRSRSWATTWTTSST